MRLRIALFLGCVMLSCLTTYAVNYTASETITVTGTPIGFTAATIGQGGGHAQATYAMCRVEGAQIRFTVDPAKTVSATLNGAILNDGEWMPPLTGADVLGNFRAIITGLTTAKLQCFYFG